MTPMMLQYFEIKSQYPDAILFFRLGDFYEMFGEDAEIASQILNITLTSRNKTGEKIPMCGVPYHSALNYISKLTRAGKKVAICEQISDPIQGKIVERSVIRVVTPGSTFDDNILGGKTNNFIAAVTFQNLENFTLILCDITTGYTALAYNLSSIELKLELEKYTPVELLTEKPFPENFSLYTAISHSQVKSISQNYLSENLLRSIQNFPTNLFSKIKQTFSLLTTYLYENLKTNFPHLKSPEILNEKNYLELDESTFKNLELFQSAREKNTQGTLIEVLDQTMTSAGGRLLRSFILKPLKDINQINARLNLLQSFLNDHSLLLETREIFQNIKDIERTISRLTITTGNARDLQTLKISIENAKLVANLFSKSNDPLINSFSIKIPDLKDLIELLNRALLPELPATIKEGNMIATNFDPELDQLREISQNGKNYLQELQKREIARTGISSLKVKFNKIFGYYIEISKANLNQVPDDYDRKQTLVGAERFTTPELKQFEEQVLTAEEKIFALEELIFQNLRTKTLEFLPEIQFLAEQIAYLDVISTFAYISWKNNFHRPEIHENFNLSFENGRHPVIEYLNQNTRFIPNNLSLTKEISQILITGPNMGGKSTFLRQTALIVLMAHLGCYVPAEKAKIPLTDKIFTRVGASDNLVRGQSTFWVEMLETANILTNATKNSLIIIDEIGRGTSTFDGVSLAWAIFEYLHNTIQAKTLFATHYHELIELAKKLNQADNYSVKVEESNNTINFLYKVLPGPVDKSYGIEVARLAGLPTTIIQRAKKILNDLELESLSLPHNLPKNQTEQIFPQKTDFKHPPRTHKSLSPLHPILVQIQNLNLETLTPIQAINLLNEFKNQLKNSEQT